MSKKRTKSGRGSARPQSGQKWENVITGSPFCEEEWNAIVVWVIGDKMDDYAHINMLAAAVNSGARKLFTHITKQDLYDQVNELGLSKNKGKIKDAPANSEICEPCRTHLEAGEEIPLPLLAKLLKFRLLDVKQKDMKRREAEQKALGTGGATEKSGKAGKGGKGEKDRAKSPAKGAKGGGKKTPEPPSPKGDSKLRRRGEEDLDKKYIDDEPDDGAQFYVFVSGFHQPALIPLLSELFVNVDAVIKVSSDEYKMPQTSGIGSETEPQPDDKQQADEDAHRQKVKARRALKDFWRDFTTLLQKTPEGSRLNDLARLHYSVKTSMMPENKEDLEKKAEFGLALFEDISSLVYDLLDARRQWKNFITNLHLYHVPVLGSSGANSVREVHSQPPTPAGVSMSSPVGIGDSSGVGLKVETDMRFYTELMDTVPQESVSVPLIMHAMLEQIEAWEEDKELPSETPRPLRLDGLHEELADHITKASFKLALNNEEISALTADLNANLLKQAEPQQPQLIDYSDRIAWRLHHLKAVSGFQHSHVETEMLQQLPLVNMLSLPQLSVKTQRERAARLQELLHFCTTATLSQAEVDHTFKQFVYENMEYTTVDQNGEVVPAWDQSNLIPWDDPYPLFAKKDEKEKEEVDKQGATPFGPVEADKLAEQLEELQSKSGHVSTSSTLSSPASPEPGRPSRSRNKKNKDNKVPQTLSVQLAENPPTEVASRPTSGILKSPSYSRSNSQVSRQSSVHFDHSDGAALLQSRDEEKHLLLAITPNSVTDLMAQAMANQKRNLDQWCFAEHFEPHVLKQVLYEASQTHPYIDTYYHQRDHSLFLVLHNPHNTELYSTVSWQTNLHSNVGFRNYLEHVAASIHEWTRVEEAKYEGDKLAKEVAIIQKEAEASTSRPVSAERKPAKGQKGTDRSKSPKKGSRGGRSSSRGSSERSLSGQSMLIREGSLKAQKLELEQAKAEEAELEKAKEEKTPRSSNKKGGKDDDKKRKKSASRSSSKSGTSKDGPPTARTPDELKTPEPQWPFSGYDVGNSMIHVGGTLTTLFPADGGQIRVSKTEFVEGTISISAVVLKDGHQFLLHVLDPREEPEPDPEDAEEEEVMTEQTEKTDEEKNEKPEVATKPEVGRFGSLSVVFNDGMSLAFSTYGPTGSPLEGKETEMGDSLFEAKLAMLAPASVQTPRSPSPTVKAETPAKTRKDRIKVSTPEPDDDVEEEELGEEPVTPQPFQQLFVTSPDGLVISFQLESTLGIRPETEDKRRLTVRQSYPFRTAGHQGCESLRHTAMEERSRLLTADGMVIRSLMDGSMMLLYPDGKVSLLEALPPSPATTRAESRSESARSGTETPSKVKVKHRKSTHGRSEIPKIVVKKPQWITTLPDGTRFATTTCGIKMDIKDVLICQATDPQTKQMLVTREDHVVCVTHPDGTMLVEHSDGTRITTTWNQATSPTQDELTKETGEDPAVNTKTMSSVLIECPGFATVKFENSTTECSITFGPGTTINASPAGAYDIYHQDGGYLQVEADGMAVYTPRPNNDLELHSPDLDMRYLFRHFAERVVEMTDNEGNQFLVKHTGDTSVSLADSKAELTKTVEKCGNGKLHSHHVHSYKQHAPRLFFVQGDGSGTELLRYQDVAEYMGKAEDDSKTAVLMDPLQDHQGVLGITILKPLTSNVAQQWMVPYTQEKIIPSGLLSRDLKTLPPYEFKKEGPVFGTNVGKGLLIGSIVRSESHHTVLKCPSMLEVRQLLQYRPVSKQLRQTLHDGLHEYARFVFKRKDDIAGLLVHDPRTEEEKQAATDLATEMATDMATDMATSLTNSARIVNKDNAKAVYERATLVPAFERCPTPEMKRTSSDWARDAREAKEEKDNLRILRNHEVPKYFNSELGKAFLTAHAPDLDHLTRQLAAGAMIGTSTATTTPDNRNQETPVILSQQSHNSDHFEVNPSPEVAKQQQQQQQQHQQQQFNSTDSPSIRGAPTPKEGLGRQAPSDTPSSHNAMLYPAIPEQPNEERRVYYTPMPPSYDSQMEPLVNRTLHVDVVGAPRTEPVTIPAYINHNGRPNALSNDKFGMVEDPVRRHIYTSSVAGATVHGAHTLARMRGFELLPNYVDLGVLKEGNTYAFPVHLKNTGIDACRFKVKQPPPSTGLQVLFRPGPIAAGMKTELTLEQYAIAVGVTGESGIGKMSHNIEIVTETDHMYLPVTATILTAHEYENRSANTPKGVHSVGVKWVSNHPPAGQGIIRPRKKLPGSEIMA